MNKNFKIVQGVEASSSSMRADLHNCYDFKELSFDAEARYFEVLFVSNTHGRNAGSPPRVRLQFKGIRKLKITDGVYETVALSVEEMGYKPADDSDLDWLVPEDRATEQDHMIIRFQNDEVVRVFADIAVLSE